MLPLWCLWRKLDPRCLDCIKVVMVGADDNGHDAAFAEYRKCVRSEVSQGLKYVNNTKQEATARKFPKVLISHAGSRGVTQAL
jgi:hypothetical protein